jgi:hypothetical protein
LSEPEFSEFTGFPELPKYTVHFSLYAANPLLYLNIIKISMELTHIGNTSLVLMFFASPPQNREIAY